MNRIYEPHKSSMLDLDANLVCLVIYLLPLLGGLLSSAFGILGWILPLVAFILEKNSPLIKFHAAQCLAIQIVVALINAVLGIFAFLSAGVDLLIGLNIFAFFSTVGIFGVLTAIVSIGVLVFEIIAMIKSYNWISYRLPVFGQIADLFVKE